MTTHEVFNQPPALEPVNLFSADQCLQTVRDRHLP